MSRYSKLDLATIAVSLVFLNFWNFDFLLTLGGSERITLCVAIQIVSAFIGLEMAVSARKKHSLSGIRSWSMSLAAAFGMTIGFPLTQIIYVDSVMLNQFTAKCVAEESVLDCRMAAAELARKHDYRKASKAASIRCRKEVEGCNGAAWYLTLVPDPTENEKQQAMKFVMTALSKDPENPQYRDTYAAALAMNGHLAEAVTEQQAAIVALPKRYLDVQVQKLLPDYEKHLSAYQNRAPAVAVPAVQK